MKAQERQKSRRTYRRSVDAYARVQQFLRAVHGAGEAVPQMKRALGWIKEASRELKKVGDAVALVIETADELEEQKDRCESFRRQAEAAGITLRYDRPAAKDDATIETSPDSDDDEDSEI